MYDYLIVGAGLFGAVFAHEATKQGKTCLVIDKRAHVGGNVYTEEIAGIQVHMYGGHIFHTSNEAIWKYIQQFAVFNHYVNAPIANYKGEIYNLPFNMNTFNRIWGVITPAEAKAKIAAQVAESGIEEAHNLEEQAVKMVGRDLYKILVKGYTEKQWGRKATDLPPFIIKRLPLRFTYNNNYFNDTYQGIPIGGYTAMIKKMLARCDVRLYTDFFATRATWQDVAKQLVFTGCIDQYFDYCLGVLDYRSLRFETEVLDMEDYQGNAAVNYTDYQVPYTRIIEHKHFEFGTQPQTVITREYPLEWVKDAEPYYPINNEKNDALYQEYRALADKEENVIFGGRLGDHRYYDMHQVVEKALLCAKNEL